MPEYSISLSSFDPALVALAFLISVFGAWCGLTCASRLRGRHGTSALTWLLATAIAIGGGAIWSMHFIGMLAYQGHVHRGGGVIGYQTSTADLNVTYRLDIPLTLISLLVAIVAAAIALAIPFFLRNVVGYALGGLLLGAGVGAMHYTGMAAMNMPVADVSYKTPTVAISLVIALAASLVALYLTLNVLRTWVRAVAAIVMGVGVSAMHYTGMLALTVTPNLDDTNINVSTPGADPFSLAMPIFGLAGILLFVLLFASVVNESADEVEIPAAPEPEPEPSFI